MALDNGWQTAKPLPVTVMAGDGRTITPLVEKLLNLFHITVFYVPQQFLITYTEQLKCFKDIVTEPVVELSFYRLQLCGTLLWE
jgi:hypothetical protein